MSRRGNCPAAAAAPTNAWRALNLPALARRALVGGGLALALIAAPAAVAKADGGGIETMNCVGGFGSFSCVRQWRWRSARDGLDDAPDPREEAERAERERRWVARCRPVIRHDQFGVRRYAYAAPGCEYGVGHQ